MSLMYQGGGHDPAVNLAREEALLLSVSPRPRLFLWQNAHTVVIGNGQNAWKECRVGLLEEEGGTLVRRTTGGGAVYHDLGNLNFSFVMPKALYDVGRQLRVIERAVAAFGIATVSSGRNDILIARSGEKFSGNAFRHTQQMSLHHGTILVAVDKALLGRYLMPSEEKLKAKGVASVRARVGNLIDHAPAITVEGLKDALFQAFQEEYGPSELRSLGDIDEKQLDELTRKYRSWEWTYGRSPKGEISLGRRFPWGQVELLFSIRQGHAHDIHCFTDANDPDLSGRVSKALEGQPFIPSALQEALCKNDIETDKDIGDWVGSLSL